MSERLLFVVFVVLSLVAAAVWFVRWRAARRDAWVPMHGAAFFNRGDVVSLGTKPAKQYKILQVTRYSVKVRPL